MILLVTEVCEWRAVVHLVEQGISVFPEQFYGLNGAVGLLSDDLCRAAGLMG